MSLRVIFLFMKYLIIPDSVAKQKKISILQYYAAIRGEKNSPYVFLVIILISIEVLIF